MKFWKVVASIIATVLLCLFVQNARTEYINLDKEKVVLLGTCKVYARKYRCMTVEHKGKTYYIVYDQRGEAYQIELLANNIPRIIWTRNQL